MTDVRVTVEGLERVQRALRSLPDAVLQGVNDAADDIARDLRAQIVRRIGETTVTRTGTLIDSPQMIVTTRRGGVTIGVHFPATQYHGRGGSGQYAFVLNSSRRFIQNGIADLTASGRIRAHIEQAISRRLEQL